MGWWPSGTRFSHFIDSMINRSWYLLLLSLFNKKMTWFMLSSYVCSICGDIHPEQKIKSVNRQFKLCKSSILFGGLLLWSDSSYPCYIFCAWIYTDQGHIYPAPSSQCYRNLPCQVLNNPGVENMFEHNQNVRYLIYTRSFSWYLL
jgi:hypothetical protein